METWRLAWILALAGFIPFGALAVAIALLPDHHPLHGTLLDSIRIWGAIVLSFLGGIRWGFALTFDPPSGRDIALSVVPTAAAWAGLFLPPPASLGILLLGFCAQGAWDSISIHGGLGPHWFAQLRIVATILVAAALAVALAGAV